MKVEDYQIAALNKYVNSELILKDYPTIDYIDILWGQAHPNILWIRIMLNVSPERRINKINKDDILEMGFDPHFLVDNLIRPTLPYFQLDTSFELDFVVLTPPNNPIYVFFEKK